MSSTADAVFRGCAAVADGMAWRAEVRVLCDRLVTEFFFRSLHGDLRHDVSDAALATAVINGGVWRCHGTVVKAAVSYSGIRSRARCQAWRGSKVEFAVTQIAEMESRCSSFLRQFCTPLC